MSKLVPDPSCANTYQFYSERWPDHCQHCGGWGQVSYEDNHGIPGPGEVVTDTCSYCMDQGKCPRCGKEDTFPFDDVQVCSNCEWDWNAPDGDDMDYYDDGYEGE